MEEDDVLMVIPGTTLRLIKELGNEILCECTTCGTRDSYNKNYVMKSRQECRYCKGVKNGVGVPKIPELTQEEERQLTDDERALRRYQIAVRDNIIDSRVISKLIREEENIKKGITARNLKGQTEYINTDRAPAKAYPIGRRIKNDYMDSTIIGYIGSVNKDGRRIRADKAVFRCNVCKALYRTEINVAKNCYLCSYLANLANKRVNEFERREKERIQKDLKAKQEKADKELQKELERQRKKAEKIEKRNRRLEKDKAERIKRELQREEKRRNRIIDEAKEINPNHFTYVKQTDTGYTIKYICKKCGYIETFHDRQSNRKIRKCEGCEMKGSFKFFVGSMKRDYTDTVINLIRLIKQYEDEHGYKCDLMCTCCGGKLENVQLIEFLEREIVCDCEKSERFCVCDRCETTFFTPLINILMSEEDIKCPRCRNKLDLNELRNDIQADDSAKTLRDKMRSFGEKTKGTQVEKLGNVEIIREAKCLYAGTDGREYFRCRCLVHNIDLTLSQSEIDNFEHTQCMDSRQMMLVKPDGTKLTLK